MRERISDKEFYRQYLRDHPEREDNPWTKAIAAAGLIGGGLLAYKTGGLKPIAERLIGALGSYRSGKLSAINQGFRHWTQREFRGGGSLRYKMRILSSDIQDSLSARDRDVWLRQMRGSSFIADRPGSLLSEITERNKVISPDNLNSLWDGMSVPDQTSAKNRYGSKENWANAIRNRLNESIRRSHNTTAEEQLQHSKRTGFRYATVADVLNSGELMTGDEQLLRGMQQELGDDFLTKIYDKKLLVNVKTNQFSDMRDFASEFGGMLDTVADDFTIPFVKINPIRMLYLNQFNARNRTPKFEILTRDVRQPAITSNTSTLGRDMLFSDGNVFSLTNLDEAVKDNVRLVDARSGPVARYYRNMAGLSISHYTRKNTTWGRIKWNVGEFLDYGLQDEPIGRDITWNYGRGQSAFEGPNLGDPTTWPSWIARQVHKVTKPYDRVSRIYLEESFGKNARWLVFNNYRNVEEAGGIKGWMRQFYAGRTVPGSEVRPGLEEVTTASLFPYAFFERLNSTLNQVGLGLSTRHTGSAFDIFLNLTTRRFLPAIGIVEAWKWANTASDSMLGFQFEDKWAEFYAGMSVDAASVRDSLGITDWAKHFTHLLPGGEQIAEIPLVGHFFDWNDSAEELQEYWESGEDPVRKGRFWEFGNTPYTGGKVEWFEPNWVRRTLSDYEFTDSLYGSRKEYFDHTWYPNPSNPLAPINRFIIDPYHWEKKHYYDRPYMVTGGFSELEDFPLIGPAVNNVVSFFLKPEVKMHEEYWDASANRDGEMVRQFVDGNALLPVFDSVGNNTITSPEYFENEGLDEDPDTYYIDPEAALGLVQTHELSETGEVIDIGRRVARRPEGEEPAHVAYTTASGDVQVARVEREQLRYLNYKIKEKGLAGQQGVSMPRLGDGFSAPFEQEIMRPQELQQVVGNLYYNLTEMGGAYGFGLVSTTGEFATGPVMASPTEMTSTSRQFWDMNIGNLGGDANEIFRRFLVKDRTQEEYNPIPNTMPSWMPGPEYFVDFQHGDPYTKLKKGEARLPGEGYEALYGITVDDSLSIGASFIGREVPDIVNHMLRRDEINDFDDSFILDTGTDWHEVWEEEMMKEGIGLDFEQYVKDESLGIKGFYDVKADNRKFLQKILAEAEVVKYYSNNLRQEGADRYGGYYNEGIDILRMREENPEAFNEWAWESATQMPIVLLDPKTMSSNKYNQDEMFYYNVQQVNFYLHATGLPRGYLIHVNRDALAAGEPDRWKVYAFDYNPDLLQHSVEKVETARAHIREGLRDGTYGRGDFYDMIDRFRILADVAPYSDQYRRMAKDIRKWEYLTDEQLEEVREIEKQVSARKENIRMYPYRFKTANVESFDVTVTEVLNNNMFLTEEFENPIRLAGIRVPTGQNDPNATRAERIINLRPGRRVTIEVDADEQNRINNDTYRTIGAVLYNKGININRQLIDSGLAKEREDDYSPAAVHARFSDAEITIGTIWENIAHIDSPFNTKFLQVRSPLESYSSREVYNKDWQDWTDPVDDFFIPWYQNIIRKNPEAALVAGTFLGLNFGNTKYGKIAGAAAGFALALAGTTYVGAYELGGDTWVPKRRHKEREMHEYIDVLKYVKYRRLYEQAADQALEEGFDVRQYIAEKKVEGEDRASFRRHLEQLKRDIVTGQGRVREEATRKAEELVANMNENIRQRAEEKGIVSALNLRIKELSNTREVEEIPSIAARALRYYQETERTMYGYDPGEPLANLLSALPKQDRDYLMPFMEAPEEERDRILGVVPEYLRRPLQAAWGMDVEPKEDLVEYFRTHGLPDENWIGWDERASLKDLKVKLVKKHGLDESEFDIWPDDEKQASMVNMYTPSIDAGNNISTIQARLSDVLRGIGLENIIVNVVEKENSNSQVFANIQKDRREEIKYRMNEEAHRLF